MKSYQGDKAEDRNGETKSKRELWEILTQLCPEKEKWMEDTTSEIQVCMGGQY